MRLRENQGKGNHFGAASGNHLAEFTPPIFERPDRNA
jgi:hypothetical protein